MPCLSPITIRNPHYKPNKKNGGVVPVSPRYDMLWLKVDCGHCFQCMRKRAMHWRFRLMQEYKFSKHKRFHFVTLTFSDYALSNLRNEFPGEDDNYICKVAVRRFLERYRKEYHVSLRHFIVTELGTENGRIHMHGMIVDCKCGYWKRDKFYADKVKLESIWKYGFIYLGWFNDKTASYITKYLMKVDKAHPDFRGKLFVSPGLGKDYIIHCKDYHRNSDRWYVVSSNGFKMSMPRYYTLKIWDEFERFNRWLKLIDDPPPFVLNGIVYDDLDSYNRAVHTLLVRTMILNLPVRKNVCNIFESSDF